MPRVAADQYVSKVRMPEGIDLFWGEDLAETEKNPLEPEVVHDPLRSTEPIDVHEVFLTSLDRVRIAGWYAAPRERESKLPGPFAGAGLQHGPAGAQGLGAQRLSGVQRSPTRQAPEQPAIQSRLSRPAHRRHRWPGGLRVPGHHVRLRPRAGILASRPEVDGARIATIGNDLAYSTAALCPQVTHLVCTPALLYGTADLARRTSAYPLEEINDHLRLNPEREQMVRGTLSYIDLRWFAPRVNSTTLLMAGADGSALDAALDPLVQSMPGETEVHKAEHSGYKDGRRSREWLSRRFGMSEPSLPPHWQG